MRQAEIFIRTEGDAWYARNIDKIKDCKDDPVIGAIERNGIVPSHVLEIGCGNGRRLKELHKKYDCKVCGVDPSADAMFSWLKQKNAHGIIGTATSLPGSDNKFDLVIFGFCLYVCDREDLFRILTESDRVLKDQGYLIVHDFFTEAPHSRTYSHHADIRSYKMDHARLWLANPTYSLVDQRLSGAAPDDPFSTDDDRTVVSVMKKDVARGFPIA